ncbi:ABC transporter ATP-binding protein [Heyndrickxia sp. NPDC080065]|uniref:ABC transporter ATP-binding protein n=1 Tax=Heyndrickxia sp. NPDC080065 TaxID=3390568 RepID=UPI003D08C360
MLTIHNISYSVDKRKFLSKKQINIIDDFSLTIKRGECVSLVGPSGSGKTTIGRIALGTKKPSRGQVLFEGKDLYKIKMTKEMRKEIQYVVQNSAASLNPFQTIRSILEEPLNNFFSLSKEEKNKRIQEIMMILDLPLDILDKKTHQLSGGQQQRINIARAAIVRPKLIILDEPISNLDRINQEQVISYLLELKDKYRLSYLFITHDVFAVKKLAEKVYVLDKGQCCECIECSRLHECTHAITNAIFEPIVVNE